MATSLDSTPERRPLLDESRLRSALATCSLGRDLVITRRTASTNADLLAAARAGAPHGTVHTTHHQSAGRGRLDRSFEQPDGSGVAVSVLVRPGVPMERWSWLPVVAGLATREAVIMAGVDAGRATLKWPNDVLVSGRKVSGILVEAAQLEASPKAGPKVSPKVGPAAVIGIGINVDLREAELPVETATSLALVGGSLDRTQLVIDLLGALERHLGRWHAGHTRDDYVAVCDTIGRRVQVSLPAGEQITGVAEAIDEAGHLVVDGRTISSGDVVHVRPA